MISGNRMPEELDAHYEAVAKTAGKAGLTLDRLGVKSFEMWRTWPEREKRVTTDDVLTRLIKQYSRTDKEKNICNYFAIFRKPVKPRNGS
jgi:hypothetical protein